MPMSPRLLRPRAASGFDPRSIAGLVAWYDASDLSTLFQNSNGTTAAAAENDPVGHVRDKGPNGYHMTQTTNNSRPLLKLSAQNGLPAILFDGTDDFLINTSGTNSFLNGLRVSVAFVAQRQSDNPLGRANQIHAVVQSGRLGASGEVAITTSIRNTYGSPANNLGAAGSNRRNGGASLDTGAAPTAFSIGTGVTPGNVNVQNANDGVTLGAARDGFGAIGSTAFNGNAFFLSGRIGEVMLYSGALSLEQRQALERYLSAKWGIALETPPVASNADAQDWINRVYANGGTVSATTAAAVNTFCNAIDAAGIRDRFYRLNLFCGDQITAALVPLYRSTSLGGSVIGAATDINSGFVAGDYVETGNGGGLGKNAGTSGTLKTLTTGLTTSNLPQFATAHFAAGVRSGSFTSAGFLMGSNGGTDQHYVYTDTTTWNAQLAASGNEVTYGNALAGSGRFVTSRTSNTLITTYRNGTSVATNTAAANPTVAGRALNLWTQSGIVGRAYYYSFGNSLTASNVTALDNAFSAFLTAMGRV